MLTQGRARIRVEGVRAEVEAGAAGLSGRDGQPPSQSEIGRALQIMVDAVSDGGSGRIAAYDDAGAPVIFE